MGRAPGRLDVMGGIADYSGSLVLQLPLAQGTFAAAQAPRAPAAGAATRPLLRIVSLQEDCEGGRDAHPARSTVFEADLVQLTVRGGGRFGVWFVLLKSWHSKPPPP